MSSSFLCLFGNPENQNRGSIYFLKKFTHPFIFDPFLKSIFDVNYFFLNQCVSEPLKGRVSVELSKPVDDIPQKPENHRFAPIIILKFLFCIFNRYN